MEVRRPTTRRRLKRQLTLKNDRTHGVKRNKMPDDERYLRIEIENAQQDNEAHFPANSGTLPPFVVKVEEQCEECGGSSYDCGSLSPIEPEDCPACRGSGKQIRVRNYLSEAFRIAAGKSSILAQREHLKAVIHHCRGLVGALMAVAEIR